MTLQWTNSSSCYWLRLVNFYIANFVNDHDNAYLYLMAVILLANSPFIRNKTHGIVFTSIDTIGNGKYRNMHGNVAIDLKSAVIGLSDHRSFDRVDD